MTEKWVYRSFFFVTFWLFIVILIFYYFRPIVRVGLDNSDGSDDSDGSDKSDGSDNSDDVEIIVNDINQSKEASSSDFNPVEDVNILQNFFSIHLI